MRKSYDTGMSEFDFPSKCPFELEQILNENFLGAEENVNHEFADIVLDVIYDEISVSPRRNQQSLLNNI